MKKMPYVYFKGKLKPENEAQVSIASNSLQYGTTCFAGIRGYFRDSHVLIFRLKDHYERLMNASKIMGFQYSLTFDAFAGIIEEMVQANKPRSDFYIRAFLFAPDEVLAPKMRGLNFDLAVYFVPLGHYFDPNQGLKMMVSSWRKFPDSAMPTKAKAGGCYVNSFIATNEALNAGYDEALLTDHEGYIVEASVANIMLVSRNRILLPEIGSALLEGITMRTAVTLLEDEGLKPTFGRIDRSLVYTADELILMGTAAQFSFAHSVDGRVIGNGTAGPICSLLRSRFRQVLQGEHQRSSEWLKLLACGGQNE